VVFAGGGELSRGCDALDEGGQVRRMVDRLLCQAWWHGRGLTSSTSTRPVVRYSAATRFIFFRLTTYLTRHT
jgi:hypothetical protein